MICGLCEAPRAYNAVVILMLFVHVWLIDVCHVCHASIGYGISRRVI